MWNALWMAANCAQYIPPDVTEFTIICKPTKLMFNTIAWRLDWDYEGQDRSGVVDLSRFLQD